MTWVVGGNCFNGFVGVADIQATLEFKDGTTQYFNCVQKIQEVACNLCVAFSGDIRSGFKIIEKLREHLAVIIKEGEYFDIDGQSKIVISWLKEYYNEINPINKPQLELIFLWNAQEGNEVMYRPFCMKFNAPNFNLNPTKLPGLTQSGSGMRNSTFQAIASFLSGKELSTSEYRSIFSQVKYAPDIVTVQNFKNILLKEASKVNHKGISKSLVSLTSVIPFKDIYSTQQAKDNHEVFVTLGIAATEMKTANHKLFLSEISLPEIQDRIKHIRKNQPLLYQSIMWIIKKSRETINIKPITELPPLTLEYYKSDEEIIHTEQLICTWEELKIFLNKKGIKVSAMQAIA